MAKIIVVSNFHEEVGISRSNMAYEYFVSRNFETVALYSTFSHSLKKFRLFNNPDFIPLKTIAYTSTLSLRRVVSYLIFAFKVFLYLRKNKADAVYVNLPPNILTLAVFLGCGKETRIIVDILDLWPESFPSNGNHLIDFALKIASFLSSPVRNYAVTKCDFCISECNLFYETLQLKEKKSSSVIHLKMFISAPPKLNEVDNVFSIVYLGNIGNIYDYESLLRIIKKLEAVRPVKLHLIGIGPKREWLLEKLIELNITYFDHGATFDAKLKNKILSSCWFGYNGFKRGAQVGLSYKSIDYLAHGVPLLNSLGCDTFSLVEEESVGINFCNDDLEPLLEVLAKLSFADILAMKHKAYSTFTKYFSGESYFTDMDNVLKSINING